MNHHINPAKAAITLAVFLGGAHSIWSMFIALGWAQAIVDFKLWVHMISIPVVVKAFDIYAAATLVIVTTAIGYVAGYVFALVWNRMHHSS